MWLNHIDRGQHFQGIFPTPDTFHAAVDELDKHLAINFPILDFPKYDTLHFGIRVHRDRADFVRVCLGDTPLKTKIIYHLSKKTRAVEEHVLPLCPKLFSSSLNEILVNSLGLPFSYHTKDGFCTISDYMT